MPVTLTTTLRPLTPRTGASRGRSRVRRLAAAGSALLAALWLCGCSAPSGTGSSALAQIRARGTLRVVTLSSPTSYYQGAQGPQGFDYRLASAFAQQLGVKLHIDPV